MYTPKSTASGANSPTQDHNSLLKPKFNPTMGNSTMGKKPEVRSAFGAARAAQTAPRKMANPVRPPVSGSPKPQTPVPELEKKEGVQVFSQGDGKKAKFKSGPKKSRKKTLIIMLIAVLILAGGLLGFTAYYFDWLPSFASETKPAADSVSPFNNDNIEHSVLKDGDFVKFGDGETTFKVDGKVRVNNLSHPEEATIAFVYLTPLEGESASNIVTLKEDAKVSFEGGDTIYVIDSFEFNNEDVSKATLCKITIHEMSKTATTETESSSSEDSDTTSTSSDLEESEETTSGSGTE